jgi:hypothetical protein
MLAPPVADERINDESADPLQRDSRDKSAGSRLRRCRSSSRRSSLLDFEHALNAFAAARSRHGFPAFSGGAGEARGDRDGRRSRGRCRRCQTAGRASGCLSFAEGKDQILSSRDSVAVVAHRCRWIKGIRGSGCILHHPTPPLVQVYWGPAYVIGRSPIHHQLEGNSIRRPASSPTNESLKRSSTRCRMSGKVAPGLKDHTPLTRRR